MQDYPIVTVCRSLTQFSFTIWREDATHFNHADYFPLAVRNAILSEYQGEVYINSISTTLIWEHPPLQAAADLFNWFKQRQAQAQRGR